MIRLSLTALILLFSWALVVPTAAQISISNSPSTSPVVGTVVRGSLASTFNISTSGVVTRPIGDATRLSTSSVTVPTVMITCGTSKDCNNKDVRVTITATGASGAGSITLFRVGPLSGTTYNTSAPAEAASLTFDVNPLGSGRSASFPLGMDVRLAAGAASGSATYTYSVSVTFV